MNCLRVKICFAAALCALGLMVRSNTAAAQQIAVKTNLLGWAAMTPDLGMELITGEKTSLALSVFGHSRPYGQDSRLFVLQPELRYWFNGRPLTREYIGISAFASSYDMTVSSHVFAGNALAAGFSGGYVFNLGRRWNLELSAGTGIALFRQKQYWEDDNYDEYFLSGPSQVNSWGYKLFPVKLAVSMIYIIR